VPTSRQNRAKLVHRAQSAPCSTSAPCSISSPTPRAPTAASSELGGLTASALLNAHGSPLLVYDEATIRAQARAYRSAAPDAFVCYGTKAFPSVALLEILTEEGIGADVSTLGEIRFAQAAGIPGDRLVMHGNNKSDLELRTAAEAGALVVHRLAREIERARAAGVGRSLVRVTPGIDADTHEKIRTGHHGSKFGLPPDDALEALRRMPESEGLHVHLGSQLLDIGAALMAVDWMASFAARIRSETGWKLRTNRPRRGSGCNHVGRATTRDRRVRPRPARRARAGLRSARPRPAAGDPRAAGRSSRVPASPSTPSARSSARRPERRGSPSTAASPTTPAPRSTAPATRRCSQTAPTSRRPGRTRSPASTASPETC